MANILENYTEDTTLQDLIDNPRKYGVPTFAEYCANPSKWQVNTPAIVDNSSKNLRRIMKKQTYTVCGIPCKTHEKAESLAKDLGHDIRTMDFKPEVVNIGGQWCEIVVHYVPKQLNVLNGHGELASMGAK